MSATTSMESSYDKNSCMHYHVLVAWTPWEGNPSPSQSTIVNTAVVCSIVKYSSFPWFRQTGQQLTSLH